jgi:hypothetical protein
MDKSEEDSSIAELVFDKNQVESADFEIAFTATLTTIVLSTASGTTVPSFVMKFTSVTLIIITVLRRMAVSSRFANEDGLLSITMPPIEFLTIITFFYLFYTPAEFISTSLALNQHTLLIAALLIPELIIFLIVFQELIFKNYMIWWGGFALGKAENTEKRIVRIFGGFLALIAFKTSLIDNLPAELDEAQEFVDEIETQIEAALSEADQELENIEVPTSSGVAIATWKGLLFFISLFVLITVSLALTFGLSLLFGSIFNIFLLVVSVMLIRHIVRFYYLAYGLPDEEQMFDRGVSTSLIMYSTYTFCLYFVFVWL